MPIKYHNAKDNDGKIITIDEAVKGTDYICLGCGNILHARKGNIREHHFFHIQNVECNQETYLHEYTKKYIKQLFDSHEHFYIKYSKKKYCPNYDICDYRKWLLDQGLEPLCHDFEDVSYDLKSYYTSCEIEQECNGFVPDLLLTNKNEDNVAPLFIEIAVTHPCDTGKVESKIRIIEIKIPRYYPTDNISTLSELKEVASDGSSISIRFYNFKRESIAAEPLNKYGTTHFYLNEYNRPHVETINNSCSAFHKIFAHANEIQIPNYESNATYEELYNFGVAQSAINGHILKECIICHYYWNDEREKIWPHKCGLPGKEIKRITQALMCDNFRYCEQKAKDICKKTTLLKHEQ